MRSKKPKSKKNAKPKDSKAKVGEKRKDKKGICFHCKAEGHWLRNCKAYLESKKKHKGHASASGMLDISLMFTYFRYMIPDLTHLICLTNFQDHKNMRIEDHLLDYYNGCCVVYVYVLI